VLHKFCNRCATATALSFEISRPAGISLALVDGTGTTGVTVPPIRAAMLFIALAAASCLPHFLVEWLFPIHVAGSFTRAVEPPGEGASTSLERHLPSLSAAPVEEPEPAPQLYDVRGNEIVLPIVRYGIDHRGSLYELHSPYTELPRLDPPEL
jgi:hypothetical protein